MVSSSFSVSFSFWFLVFGLPISRHQETHHPSLTEMAGVIDWRFAPKLAQCENY
jgi:hypothetical protein